MSGLEINGNGSDRCGVKIQKGIFVLNGGRIRQTGDTSSTYGGVILPDDSNAQFIMLKGNISDNRGSVATFAYSQTIVSMQANNRLPTAKRFNGASFAPQRILLCSSIHASSFHETVSLWDLLALTI